MSAALKPTVLWAQRSDSVYVTIDLKDVQDMELKIEEKDISFKGKSAEKDYEFSFEFFDAIKKDETKIRQTRLIEIILTKAGEEDWSKLNKEGKLQYVKIDWNKWADEDEEAESFDQSGFGGMPGGMGGMGGMPGMGGMGGMPGMGGMGGMPGMGGMGGMPGMGGMGDMDFSKMMEQMGGMGAMGGMGDDDDEDDAAEGDVLGDLDEPVDVVNEDTKDAVTEGVHSEEAQVGA